MATIIRTERLDLREWEDRDREPYLAACNTPAVTRWLGGVQEPEQFGRAVERMQKSQAEHGHCFWVVERRADHALLGFCGIKLADTSEPSANGLPEIGWRLREDVWGQGYAKEAATASLGWAFGVLRAETVVAFTLEGNAASWGLMERLGMTRQPDFIEAKYGSELNPTVYYRLDRADWLVGAKSTSVRAERSRGALDMDAAQRPSTSLGINGRGF